MNTTRRLFLGAIAVAASILPLARQSFASAAKPKASGLKALIEAKRAAREAGPACVWGDTRTRGVNGMCARGGQGPI